MALELASAADESLVVVVVVVDAGDDDVETGDGRLEILGL